MNIKIPRTDLNQGSQRANSVSDKSRVDSTQNQSTSDVSGDTITFTNTAAEMLKLEDSLANLPDIDNSRVAAIKASIADGSYQVDPEKIVDSLLNIEKDLH
ncbi:MAG: flagellar biosynthesis anti-sigma factor FlgM [Porticoccus sp.]